MKCRKCGTVMSENSMATPGNKFLKTTYLCPACCDRFTVTKDNPHFVPVPTPVIRKDRRYGARKVRVVDDDPGYQPQLD